MGSWVKRDDFIPNNSVWYNYGDCNSCCKGTDDNLNETGRPGANIIDNCVGFANGAFNETFYKNMLEDGHSITEKQYFRFTCNANLIIQNRINTNPYQHPAVSEGLVSVDKFNTCLRGPHEVPPEGGLIFWGGGSTNHVAYISRVIDENNIEILHSGWKTPSWTTAVDGGYKCNKRILTRHYGSRKNIWWFNNDGYKLGSLSYCQGFFANPGITMPLLSFSPRIDSVEQSEDLKTLMIKGHQQSKESNFEITHTYIYYKWDGPVDISDYDGIISIDGSLSEFAEILHKPAKASLIALLPISYRGAEVMGRAPSTQHPLINRVPCIRLLDKQGNAVSTRPYVYSGHKWRPVTPILRDGDTWYKIYNNSKEKV